MIELANHVLLPTTPLILVVAKTEDEAQKIFDANHPGAVVVQVYRVGGDRYYFEVK